MKIPDYVSPIVGYRVWSWDNDSLVSLNGESWPPNQALRATCGISPPRAPGDDLSDEKIRRHEAPKGTCTCGIYATNYPDPSYGMGLWQSVIAGEVFLWGTVVEHEWGWRAQFAYPKSLILTRESIPYGAKNVQRCLAAVTAYGADVLLAGSERNLILWTKDSGYSEGGLNILRQAENQLDVAGLRVAILSDKTDRVSILMTQVKLSENAQVIFTQAGLPFAASDSFSSELRRLGVQVVLFDSQVLEDNLSSIRAIKKNARDVAIFAITPDYSTGRVIAAAVRAGVDEIIRDALYSADGSKPQAGRGFYFWQPNGRTPVAKSPIAQVDHRSMSAIACLDTWPSLPCVCGSEESGKVWRKQRRCTAWVGGLRA